MEVIETLLAVGASPEYADADGWPPLRLADWYGQQAAYRRLLRAAPHMLGTADPSGQVPLVEWAKANPTPTVLEMLGFMLSLDPSLAAPPATALGAAVVAAAKAGRIKTLNLLLDAGPPELAATAQVGGRLAIHAAAKEGHCDVLRELLQPAPATVTASAADSGHMPRHEAALGNHVPTIDLLLEAAPAALSAQAADGCLPLGLAAAGRRAATACLLQAHPAAALATDNRGRTPLAVAVEYVQHAARNGWHIQGRLETAHIQAAARHTAGHCAAAPGWRRRRSTAPLRHPASVLAPGRRAVGHHPCPLRRHRGSAAHGAGAVGRAGCLVARLPAADKERLRVAALALARRQRALAILLPPTVTASILACCAQ